MPRSARPANVGELPSPGKVNNDPFELLLQQVRTAHYGEIRRLSLEVESLRSQLADRRAEAPDQWDPPAEQFDPPAEEFGFHDASEANGPAPATPTSDCSRGVEAAEPALQVLPSSAPSMGSLSSQEGLDACGSIRLRDGSLRSASGETLTGLSESRHRQEIMREYVKHQDPLYRLVHSPVFEVFFAALIIIFGVFLAFEAQFVGLDLAVATGHASASRPSKVVWPDGEAVLSTLQWVFGAVFLLEMALKLAGMRRAFFHDPWNWLDIAVNALWLYSLLEFASIPVNPQIARISRLVRLLRLMRLVKYLKGNKFDSLYLMTTAVKGSVATLTWSIVVLLLVHLMLSILLSQILRDTYFVLDDPSEAAGQVEVYEYFGTFFRALLTMFEITLANWPPACRILIENVSEWFILYAVLHKMVLGFAVIGVVNGVFIQETFKVATLDDTVMVRQTKRKLKAHQSKMMRLFEEADDDGSGFLDVEEWKRICEDEWVKLWLSSQELTAADAQSLFAMIDDGDGKLGAEELIKGASRLRGAAATIDTLQKLDQLTAKVDGLIKDVSANK